MWILKDGQLIQMKDVNRVKFRTSISNSVIDEIQRLAEEYDTYPNYLIETGIRHVLNEGVIVYDKKKRPKDRVQYQTTYDKELLALVKEFAKQHNLYVNDVIEYCCRFVDKDSARARDYRYRIERQI